MVALLAFFVVPYVKKCLLGTYVIRREDGEGWQGARTVGLDLREHLVPGGNHAVHVRQTAACNHQVVIHRYFLVLFI